MAASVPASTPVPDRATLNALLVDPFTARAYEEFARREHNEENLQLLRRISEFKRHTDEAERARLGVALVNKYVRAGHGNVDSKSRGTLEAVAAKIQSMQTAGATAFAEELEVLSDTLAVWENIATRELVGDSLPRFLASDLYRTALEQSRMSETTDRRASIAARARGVLHSLGQSIRLNGVSTTAVLPADGDQAAPVAVELKLATPAERKRSLIELLAHARSLAAFKDFCRKELCDENVELLLEIRAFRDASDPQVIAKSAKTMLDTYIRAGSRREANVDSRTRMHAEMMLSRLLAAPTGDARAAPAASPLLGTASRGGPSPAASSRAMSIDGEDALAKVETELINMLSGELLPRFATSKMWTDIAAPAPIPAARSAMPSMLKGGARPGLPNTADARVDPVVAARTGVPSTVRPDPAAPAAAPNDIVAQWAAALSALEAPDAAAAAGGKSLLSLREKKYLFGISVTAAMRSLGGGPKKSDLVAVGAEIRRTSIKSGYLLKRAHHKASWKRRWFVLTPTVLAYFADAEEEAPSGAVLVQEIASVSMTWDAAEPCPADVSALTYTFVVHTAHRPYALQATSTRERERWAHALQAARDGQAASVNALDWSVPTARAALEEAGRRVLAALPLDAARIETRAQPPERAAPSAPEPHTALTDAAAASVGVTTPSTPSGQDTPTERNSSRPGDASAGSSPSSVPSSPTLRPTHPILPPVPELPSSPSHAAASRASPSPRVPVTSASTPPATTATSLQSANDAPCPPPPPPPLPASEAPADSTLADTTADKDDAPGAGCRVIMDASSEAPPPAPAPVVDVSANLKVKKEEAWSSSESGS